MMGTRFLGSATEDSQLPAIAHWGAFIPTFESDEQKAAGLDRNDLF
jgi:hypothetical protein